MRRQTKSTHIAESARMPIAFDALCTCQQNVQF